MTVGPNEDRVVAWRGARADAAAMSAAIQSASSEPVANASSRTGRPRDRALRAQSLDEARPGLEAIGIVESDRAVGRIEDRPERSVVPSQHDGPGAG